MSEAEQLCDKIAFLNHGRIVATGTQKELKKIIGARDKIIIELSSGVKLPKLSVEGVIGVDLKGERLTILVDDAEKRIKDVLNLLSPVYRYIKKISMEEANLEDVFVELAKRD
jgi:ABC-2 type transport system ATP-binding protein